MKRTLPLIGLAIVLLLLILPPIFGSRYTVLMVAQVLVAASFAMSYNMLLGHTGLLSFGHAVYFGAGVFTALYMTNGIGSGGLPLPLELVPLGAGLGGLIAALVLGPVSVKSGQIAFAMITLGIAELVAVAAMVFPSAFGGEQGISTDRMVDLTLTGLNYGRAENLYWLILVWACLAIAAMAYLTRTPLGRLANAVRDNQERVVFLGYSPFRIRYMQFCLSGAFAGVAGGLFALLFEISNSDIFGLRTSADVLIATYLGGTSFVFGPVLGAALVTLLESNLSRYTEAWLSYYGLLFVVIVLFAPKGIWSLFAAIPPTVRRNGLGPTLLRGAYWFLMLLPGCLGGILVIEMSNHHANAFDPTEPLMLAGLPFDIFSAANWLLALALLALSAGMLWQTKRRQAARQIQAMTQEAHS
ncbi:branched-chain amino acid ABC transporter permease [Castellaniella sp.]|uniref:branched-chain amino acid ABC transporter permease n=1 Tax=Castellaniella sp. TaxID=1955812 RepID=UPI003C714B31